MFKTLEMREKITISVLLWTLCDPKIHQLNLFNLSISEVIWWILWWFKREINGIFHKRHFKRFLWHNSEKLLLNFSSFRSWSLKLTAKFTTRRLSCLLVYLSNLCTTNFQETIKKIKDIKIFWSVQWMWLGKKSVIENLKTWTRLNFPMKCSNKIVWILWREGGLIDCPPPTFPPLAEDFLDGIFKTNNIFWNFYKKIFPSPSHFSQFLATHLCLSKKTRCVSFERENKK